MLFLQYVQRPRKLKRYWLRDWVTESGNEKQRDDGFLYKKNLFGNLNSFLWCLYNKLPYQMFVFQYLIVKDYNYEDIRD